jgi:alanyl-tRNA synthetase
MTKNHSYIIADHIRASCFLIGDGVKPSGKQQGYVLRRLIRRSLSSSLALGIDISNPAYFSDLVDSVIGIYDGVYEEIKLSREFIVSIFTQESQKYLRAIDTGKKEWTKILSQKSEKSYDSELVAQKIFDLYQTHGVPMELSEDLLQQQQVDFDRLKLSELIDNHQNQSQVASQGQFKSGLGEQNEKTTRLHTATHLLHHVLRDMFGESVKQMGSAITTEKARFDFTKDERLSDEEMAELEKNVQHAINNQLEVEKREMSEKEARELGAIGLFGEKYGDVVTIYTVQDTQGRIFSREFCGGPHVLNTKDIGTFKILKQKSVGQGLKRIEFDVMEKK